MSLRDPAVWGQFEAVDPSALHGGEDVPAEMFTCGTRIASGLAGERLAHLERQFAVRVPVEQRRMLSHWAATYGASCLVDQQLSTTSYPRRWN